MIITQEQLKDMQEFLFIEQTGVWDEQTNEAMEFFRTEFVEDHWAWAGLWMPSNWYVCWHDV